MTAIPEHVPRPGPLRPIKIPPFADRTLPTGLRVIAIRRPSVPRIEARLRIPAGPIYEGGEGARARLLAETLLSGTAARSSVEIATELQRLGASLGASVDSDDLVLAGGALAGNARGFLDLFAEVLRSPSFPAEEVSVARDRLAQGIIIQRADPATIASEALSARLFGTHRYGHGLPSPDRVRRINRGPIEGFWRERVVPKGSTLVLVGDLRPDKTIAMVEETIGAWKRRATGPPPASPPTPRAGLPALIVDRPGSVQTNIRLAGPGIPRSHPDFFKLALASMVFGGYFSSRLNLNIREAKGYTYGAGSSIAHRRRISTVTIATDVGIQHTGLALVEINYELSRIVTAPASQQELDDARRYLAGVTLLSIQTQAGLAGYADALTSAGLELEYLRSLRARLDAVTLDDVREAAARYLTPRALTTVLVSDASVVRSTVEALTEVEIGSPRR